MTPIATQIAELRAATGLNLEQFAARCGLSHSTVLRYEQGKISPTVEALEKIATGTGRPLEISFGPRAPTPSEVYAAASDSP